MHFLFFVSSISLSLFSLPSGWLTPMIGPHEIDRDRMNERTNEKEKREREDGICLLLLSLLPFEDVPCADDWRDSKMKRSNRYNLTCLMASTSKATRESIESLRIYFLTCSDNCSSYLLEVLNLVTHHAPSCHFSIGTLSGRLTCCWSYWPSEVWMIKERSTNALLLMREGRTKTDFSLVHRTSNITSSEFHSLFIIHSNHSTLYWLASVLNT